MARKESNISAMIEVAVSAAGGRLWRNMRGKGWVGKHAMIDARSVMVSPARFVEFGMKNGASDLIGIAPDGRMLAIEVKAKTGRVSKDQEKFIDIVRRFGGRAGVARSVEDAVRIATEPLDAE